MSKKDKILIISIAFCLTVIIVGLQGIAVQRRVLATTTSDINTHSNSKNIQNDTLLITKILAGDLENHIQKVRSIIELTSKLPQLRNVSYVNLINSTLHGIPANVDLEKREIAKNILSKYPQDFVAVTFILPNGNVYMIEPYQRQENLSTSNLAFRDYYKGAISTHDTYLSNVITSAASGLNQIQIAVPMYLNEGKNRDTTSSLIGIWTAALNLKYYNNLLQSLNLTGTNSNNTRIVIVDTNGVKIADSDKNQISSVSSKSSQESFATLQSFKNAMSGKSGSIIETVGDGTKMLVHYRPVKAIQTNWIILFMQKL